MPPTAQFKSTIGSHSACSWALRVRHICREHIESESRGRRMSDKEVNPVLDEIAPKSESERATTR